MRFAVFTVSTPAYTPEEVVGKLKEYGYDGIEWRVVDEPSNPRGMGFWHGNKCTIPFTGFVENAKTWRTLAEDAGLEMPSLGTYVSASNIEDVETAMKGAVELGVKRLRINTARYDGSESFRTVWEKDRENYKRVAELAEKYSLKALIELHMGSITPSASAARMYVDGFDPKHVGIIHDAGNMVYEGFENYRMGLELLGEYLSHVHVKNARWFPVKYLEDKTVVWKCDATAIHKGIADIRDLFRALHLVDYDDWISFEDFSVERPLDVRLEENIRFVKKVIAELTAPVADTPAKA